MLYLYKKVKNNIYNYVRLFSESTKHFYSLNTDTSTIKIKTLQQSTNNKTSCNNLTSSLQVTK